MTEQEARKLKLSKNFNLWEFLESEAAEFNGLSEKQLQIPADKIANLVQLCANVLQPVRDKYNMAIKINSGYRCDQLNKTIGGAVNSDHMQGRAADITCSGLQFCFSHIKDHCEFDQLIYYRDRKFIHVSYRHGNNRKEVIYK
jgi:zinc D-Ala-D-Ala carboxypeptidase